MRTFPAEFAAELAKKTGLSPVWILRLTISGIVYDISDSVFVFPVGMGNGFTTTLNWIAAWGEIRESISGSIGEMLVSDFPVSLYVDQDVTDNIRHLALNHPLEKSPAELYLWFDGLTAATPPQKLFVGYVKDIDTPDETVVNLTIEDESTRFQKYIGARISSEVYPLCDPDTVGKMIPIVYGVVPKLPAVCVDSGWVSSLIAAITATSTTMTVSEIPAYSLMGKIISIEDEQVLIGTPTGNIALADLGCQAFAQSTFSPDIPANMIKGVWGYPGWQSALGWNTPQWIYIAFPASQPINKIILRFNSYEGGPTPGGGFKDFTVKLSNDLITWDYTTTITNNNLAVVSISIPATNAKYIHIDIATTVTGSFPPMLFAIEAYTTAVLPPLSRLLPIIRGYNGTIATTHDKGAVIIENKTSPLVYLCADHPLDAIGNIMARIRGVNVDITSDCTKYLGSPTNQLAAYPGRAAITIPNIARVTQRISIALQGNVNATDPGHMHNTGGTSDLSASQDASGVSTTISDATVTWDAVHNQNKFPASQETQVRSVNFAPISGTIKTCAMTATVTVNVPATGGYWYLQCGGKRVTSTYSNSVSGYNATTVHDATSMQGNALGLVVAAVPNGQYGALVAVGGGTITAAHRNITYSNGQQIIIQPAASGVLVTNTLQLSGNSVADIAVGDAVLVDVTRNISAPLDVMNDFLSTYCNDTSLIQVGTFPSTYSLNGAITEYKKAIEWLDYLSFQCRAFFRKMAGVSRLIVRDVNPVVTGTIPACCLTSEGIKGVGYKKAPLSDVINKVKVLYSRDWTAAGKQAESYKQATAPCTSAASIGDFGEQEQPDMFMFDFVTGTSMANDLATFYLQFYAERKWRIGFSTFLDHAQFEFGDTAQLSFANNLVGGVVEAGFAPGSTEQMDKINFVIEAAIIPVVGATDMTTLLGDQLKTKDGEVLTYV